MGVKGLWRLLLPIGRRISIETLEGRVLAIDASIWLTQFLKANRDPDTGTVRPHAHIVGFLRRICRLLYHNIRPVFVFDGATPEIKLREIRARRERRERMTIGIGGGGGGGTAATAGNSGGGGDDDGAIKRMARKLLVAELKRQKELKQVANAGSARKGGSKGTKKSPSQSGGAFSSNFNLDGDDEDDIEDEKEENGDDEPARDGEAKNQSAKDDDGADEGIVDLSELDDGAEYLRGSGQDHRHEGHAHNDWDDPKPALFGSDDGSSSSSSAASTDGDVLLPEDEDQLDIDAVLSLPAGQRKDIIEKAKRQQRMRSRKEFMPAAADPEAYSQVQLRNFLRSSNLNKKINEMGAKAARGGGVDGLEGEAIASDATRRFIFTKDSDKTDTAAASAAAIATSQLDDTTPSRRHRLRRLGRNVNAAADSDDEDDEDIFGGELNHKTAQGKATPGKARPFYSSSEDDDDDDDKVEGGGGGFLIEDNINGNKVGGSPDPKRSNYKSHTHHDASGWTLDEANVFGASAGMRDSEASDNDDDDGGGGGFLVEEDTPSLSISLHDGARSSNARQVAEDEMLARALQEAEDDDAATGVAEESNAGGFLVATSAHASKRSQNRGTVMSRRQEESDAILAAQLEAEERNKGRGKGRPSETIDLSGSSDKRRNIFQGKKAPVVLLDSDSDKDNSDDDSDVEILPPPGKRKRGGVQAKRAGNAKAAPKNESNDAEEDEGNDDDDDIAWEDGDADEDATGRKPPTDTASMDAALQSDQEPPQDTATESQDGTNTNDKIDWEDGDDKDEQSEGEMPVKAAIGKAAPKVPTVDQIASDEEDDIAWEDGEGQADEVDNELAGGPMESDDDGSKQDAGEITDVSRRNSSRRSSLSVTDGDIDGHAPNDFTASPSDNANVAALKHAEETAANLTNWAGRAMRRAIAAHMEESGTQESPQGSKLPTASASAKVSEKSVADEIDIDDSSDASSDDEELDGAGVVAIEKEAAADNEGEKALSEESAHAVAFQPVPGHDQATSTAGSPARTAAASTTTTAAAICTTTSSSTVAAPAGPTMDTSLEALRMEHSQMQDELNRQQRDMDTVTDDMKEEVIQLLQLFGIPYVEAPAEAEAQACALEALGLVDGVVTEDSDAFVFGGKKVYKNIFDDQRFVEAYFASDAERDLGLGPNHMVALAMLLGGDYTQGVKGVGIVNGMEVLQAFDVSADIKSGLSKFRKWLDGFELTDNVARTPAEKEFHNKHRSARNRWIAPKDFPSPSVLTAYQKPVVDKSEARFSWGLPDIEALRIFCARKIGWPAEETDRVIMPVIKALESSGSRQTRLESYFMRYDDDIKFANVKSKRLQSVLRKVKGSNADTETKYDNSNYTESEGTAPNITGSKKRKNKSSGKKNKKPKPK